MTQEEKQLLLKDICARLHCGVIMTNIKLPETHYPLTCEDLHDAMFDDDWDDVPYLRPISSMTKEEKSDLQWIVHDETDGYCTNDAPYYTGNKIVYLDNIPDYIDFMCEHHLDYHGLIEKELALKAPEEMYKEIYKEQNGKVEH